MRPFARALLLGLTFLAGCTSTPPPTDSGTPTTDTRPADGAADVATDRPAADVPAVDTGGGCTVTGETLCAGACVNTNTSTTHCGSCGRPCMTGETCAAGVCTTGTPCPTPGNVSCSGACVDTQTDPRNCGSCARACAATETCAMGMCRVATMCPTGQTDCGGGCVDTSTSTLHCGSCGRACATGESCMGGSCVPTTCPTGQMRCGAACVDTQADAANCGTCGMACAAGQICTAGACRAACAMTECTAAGMTVCTDTQTDVANCGTCGNACAAGQLCTAGVCGCGAGRMLCGGTCVDTMTDNANCGRCTNPCPAAQTCGGGVCGCTAPLTACGTACTLTSLDAANCGMCGNICPTARPACVSGTCSASACPMAGNINCGGTCIDPQTSNTNCGTCGTACGTGRTCTAGVCRPANDLRANAIAITLAAAETTVMGTTVNATRDGPTVPCGCTSAGNVWYRFTLARRGVVYFDTAGAATTYDSSLFITDSAGVAVPGQAASGFGNAGLCNDDSGCAAGGGFTSGNQARTAGVLAAGSYFIAVGGCTTGPFVLHAQFIPDNSGSFFYSDRLIGGGTTASTTLVGTSAAAGTCGGTASGEDVRWFLTCGGQQQFFSNCVSDGGSYTRRIGTINYDPSLYVRSAQTGTQVVCNDDGGTMGGTNCIGTGGDTAQYGSRVNNVVVPRGIAATFIDERIGGSGMRYTLRFITR